VLWKTVIGLYLLVIGLLVSNVLSMAWMIIVQIGAIAGLLLIGSICYQGVTDKTPNDSNDPLG
jgi:hypothetical protein